MHYVNTRITVLDEKIMEILLLTLMVFAGILVMYAALPLLSMLIAATTRSKNYQFTDTIPNTDFACIITAYGDASIAIEQVKSILNQSYTNYHIYMVGDHCLEQPAFPADIQLSVIYPEIALHSKIKSIRLAIQSFIRPHTHILILDADNLLHENALAYINVVHLQGYKAVQGQRTAKNLDTTIAALDALGELYYNITQRWVPFQIGSSATIAGSGMSIEAAFFTAYVAQLLSNEQGVILAEDKLLQMMLAEQDIKIAYCREALIFDEKVREGAQVQRQRTRWLRSWFDHWGQAIQLTLKGIGKGSWNCFYFGFMLSLPPMVMLVGGLLFMAIVGLLFHAPLFWLSLLGVLLFFAGFGIALLFAPAPARVWQAVPYIPVFVLRQIMAILKLKASSKDFMATTHTQHLSMEQVWEQRKFDFPYLKK